MKWLCLLCAILWAVVIVVCAAVMSYRDVMCTLRADAIVLASLMSYKFVYDFKMHRKVMTWMCISIYAWFAAFCAFYLFFLLLLLLRSFFLFFFFFSSFAPSIQSTRSTNANFFTHSSTAWDVISDEIYIFSIRFAFMHMRCQTHSRSTLSMKPGDDSKTVESEGQREWERIVLHIRAHEH